MAEEKCERSGSSWIKVGLVFIGALGTLIAAVGLEAWKHCQDRHDLKTLLCADLPVLALRERELLEKYEPAVSAIESGTDFLNKSEQSAALHDLLYPKPITDTRPLVGDTMASRLGLFSVSTATAVYAAYANVHNSRDAFESLMDALYKGAKSTRLRSDAKAFRSAVNAVQAATLEAQKKLKCG